MTEPEAPRGIPVFDRAQGSRLGELLLALSMTVGRAKAARVVSQLAEIRPTERLLDVGCGPGTAVRTAAGLGAVATGVDPSRMALALARGIGALRPGRGVTFMGGSAECIPAPEGSAEIVWALSSVHHWSNRTKGLEEAYRVLVPGGRLLLVERSLKERPRGHAGHGLTTSQCSELMGELSAAGFVAPRQESKKAGRRKLTVITAKRPTS